MMMLAVVYCRLSAVRRPGPLGTSAISWSYSMNCLIGYYNTAMLYIIGVSCVCVYCGTMRVLATSYAGATGTTLADTPLVCVFFYRRGML